MRALIQCGAKVDTCDGVKRCTALHMAARRGNVGVAEARGNQGPDSSIGGAHRGNACSLRNLDQGIGSTRLASSSMMQHDNAKWQPFHEPLRNTLARTGTIALVVGALLALRFGRLAYWPIATLLVLWPSFGGHWVELWFLNYLRPSLPTARVVQAPVRVGVWFFGGVGLLFAMRLTAMALGAFQRRHWPAWWVGGLAFIGIELVAHLVLQLRGQSSFYNGRG